MVEKLWEKVARNIIKAGMMPMTVGDTLIQLLQTIMSGEQAKFVAAVFKKPNLNREQIEQNTDLRGNALDEMLKSLMYQGIISGTPSRSTGVLVYHLQPPFPGMFEFQLMRPGESDHEKKLARLFDKLFDEMSKLTQNKYDDFMPQVKNFPPIDRIVPVEQTIEPGEDVVLPIEDIKKIVDKNDIIAIALCYCRHEKDLLDESCKLNAPRKNCFLFGKSAQFCIEQKFAELISKEKTMLVMKEAEEYGLVHKAFHIAQDIDRDENAICNCCNCCCGTFQLYRRGVMPFYSTTSYIAKLDADHCVGCGTCVDKCPMEALTLEDPLVVVNEDRCIGCGVCVYNCPEDPKGIKLSRTGIRRAFVPPPRLQA